MRATTRAAGVSRGKHDVELEPPAIAFLAHLERRDARARALDLVDHLTRRLAGRQRDEQPPVLRAEASEDSVRDDSQWPEGEQHERRRAHRGAVVAGARGETDRCDDPERRGRRKPSHREPLPDDRAGAEKADAGDDLRSDPRRVRAHDVRSGIEEGVEAVRADDREQGRAQRNEQVRAQAGLALAQLALDADQTAEQRGEREPQQRLVPVEGRQLARRELQQRLPLAPRPALRSRRQRARAARRGAHA